MAKQWHFTDSGNFFKLKENISETLFYISKNTATMQIHDSNSFLLKIMGENISEIINWNDVIAPAGGSDLESTMDLVSAIINFTDADIISSLGYSPENIAYKTTDLSTDRKSTRLNSSHA